MYNIKNNDWTFVKPGANEDLYLYVKQPFARYLHAGVYVELDDLDTYMFDGETPLRRKYLYIYGGFSYECVTACLDLWRYEIPWGPMGMYPEKIGKWHNRANHWTLVIEDPNYSPGPRVKTSMVALQTFPNATLNITRNDHYLYIFGGIKIRSDADALEIKKRLNIKGDIPSFDY